MRKHIRTIFFPAVIMTLLILLLPFANSASGQVNDQESFIYVPFLVSDPAGMSADCWPQSLPAGAATGQPLPVFCSIRNQGPDTSEAGPNSWVDNFDHNLSFTNFTGTNYTVFEEVGFIYKTIHWRHANHWMVDIASHDQSTPRGWVRGSALMRPDQTFHFENGKFVVEVVAAAGMEAYGGDAWPEIVISTSARPHDWGALYGYDLFPEGITLGCRLQSSRYPVCALKDDNGSIENNEGSRRLWEMSAIQAVGQQNYGGSPYDGRERAWRICRDEDPDMECRDLFRLELTQTSLTLFVNGVKYFEQRGIPPLPVELLNGELYVYFASVVVSHPAEALRFHWDDIRVNPDAHVYLMEETEH